MWGMVKDGESWPQREMLENGESWGDGVITRERSRELCFPSPEDDPYPVEGLEMNSNFTLAAAKCCQY